jgi:hypothetical protein
MLYKYAKKLTLAQQRKFIRKIRDPSAFHDISTLISHADQWTVQDTALMLTLLYMKRRREKPSAIS